MTSIASRFFRQQARSGLVRAIYRAGAGELDLQRSRPGPAQAHEAMICSHPDSVLVKTHNALAMDRFGPLITLKLTAGAIYVLRNPLAVAISYSHHLGETIGWTIRLMNSPGAGTPNTPTNVFQQLRSWSEHVRSWTAQAHSPRYPLEDMLSAPEKRFGGVAGFLGLRPPRERLLRY